MKKFEFFLFMWKRGKVASDEIKREIKNAIENRYFRFGKWIKEKKNQNALKKAKTKKKLQKTKWVEI